MKLKDITNYLEAWAPLSLQEPYDNSGLLIGDAGNQIDGVLITLDVTEEVVDEAISKKCQLIIAHHPLIFSGIKRIRPDHWVSRCIIKAIKNDISIYAIHTNLDNVISGVNGKIADRIGLKKREILGVKTDTLTKLTTFIPKENTQPVLNALYQAGAGSVGAYDHCSFRTEGTGTFRPGEETNPHIGMVGKDEEVNEDRVEVLVANHQLKGVLHALTQSHPYEEVAYYLTPLSNPNQEIGSGMVGELSREMEVNEFLDFLKSQMQTQVIRHTKVVRNKIKKVALCGGSGSFLLKQAIAKNADVFVSADFKYHDFFEANGQIMVADIGHFESEQFTKELLHEKLQEKFANIALHFSKVNTNPILYS